MRFSSQYFGSTTGATELLQKGQEKRCNLSEAVYVTLVEFALTMSYQRNARVVTPQEQGLVEQTLLRMTNICSNSITWLSK